MKALVTGGAGFIGSNLSLNLLNDGWKVHFVDDMSSGIKEHVTELETAGAEFHYGSYGTVGADVVGRLKPDAVFHLGAVPRVLYSVENPVLTNENNVQETLRFMEACRGNVGRFVFSSSSSVNGDTNVLPTPETLNRRPKSPYALQKAIIEDYCRLWSELYKMDTVSLRYFNVFGPRQYGDSPYSTVVSAWCNNVKEGKPLRLDGSGEQSRDFCYVDNVVTANLLAATSSKTFKGDVFNIAGGQVHTVNDVLAKFRERCGNVELTRAPPRQGDVFATEADLSRAAIVLGYEPRVDFDEGMKRTFEWWGI